MNVNYHQQAPPYLTFASPWAKPNSAMDQELLQCFHFLKSTLVFNQKFFSGLE